MSSVEEQKLYFPPVHLGKTVGEGQISQVEVVEVVEGMHSSLEEGIGQCLLDCRVDLFLD